MVAAFSALAAQSALADFPSFPQFVFTDIPVSIAISIPAPGSVINLIPGTESIQGGPNPMLGVLGTGGSSYMVSTVLDKNNNPAGHQFTSCVAVATGAAVENETPGQIRVCNQIININGQGQIMYHGMLADNLTKQTFAITGGTGKFRNATGQVTVTEPVEHVHQISVYLWQ